MARAEPGCLIARSCGQPPVGGPAVFLDRDGVINEDRGYVHRPGDTRWVPGIFAFCRAVGAAGYPIVVVTNQSGIARGYFDEAEFVAHTTWLHEEFFARSVNILSTWYCPHHPTLGIGDLRVSCECRKPKPGLLLAAAEYHGIDLAASILVGDRQRDLQAARRAGVSQTFLLSDNGFAAIARAIGVTIDSAVSTDS